MGGRRVVPQEAGPQAAWASLFSIADVTFALDAPYDLAGMGLHDRLGPFLCEAKSPTPSVRIRWREGDPARMSEGKTLFDPGELWRLSRRPDGCRGYCATVGYGEGHLRAVQAALTSDAEWSIVEVVEQRRSGQWKSLLGLGVGELIFRMRMLFCQGLVLHASGIDDGGHGLLFVGHSGAGKSTQAAIWEGETGVVRMGDDRIAVRLTGAGAMAYDIPWGRPVGPLRDHRAPLSAILLVEQASHNQLLALAPAQAAPLLMPKTFLPYGDEGLLRLAFATLEALLTTVPVYRLCCRPEPAVIQLVRDGLCTSRIRS
jgi:hypothetical protein